MNTMSKHASEAIQQNPTPKYFKITQKQLLRFAELTPKQRDLLFKMISKLKLTHELSSFIGSGKYSDFGYEARQHYYRDKKALEKADFIITEGKEYYVRLDAVMYTSKRNYDHILKQVGARKDPFNGFRGNTADIPPPPVK